MTSSARLTGIVALFVVTAIPAAVRGTTMKLNPPLVNGGNVTSSRISPDGTRVVYRADQDTDEVFELYSVPLAGGPSTKLSGPMVNGGNTESIFQNAPDSSRVIYFADQDTDEILELYSVPIDGSAPPVKLNGPLVSGGNVDTFALEISQDSSRVVYLADQDVAGQNEVYSRLIDGSGTSAKLNGPLISGGELSEFRISPDLPSKTHIKSFFTTSPTGKLALVW